jgi:uncharacterized membrane protein YqgA involved in biofilm formation
VLLDPNVPIAHDLAILGGLLVGGVIGELLRLQDALDGLGDWFQRRLARARSRHASARVS